MNITFFYAALLAPLFVFLSRRAIRLRRALKIGVGDAGNTRMLRAMRVHANFAEYVPFALLLIFFVEMKSGHPWFVHMLGAALFAGRLSHAYGVSQENENFKFRIAGMILTFTVLILSSFYLLYAFFIELLK